MQSAFLFHSLPLNVFFDSHGWVASICGKSPTVLHSSFTIPYITIQLFITLQHGSSEQMLVSSSLSFGKWHDLWDHTVLPATEHLHDINFTTVIRHQFEAAAVKHFEPIAFTVWITNVHAMYIDWQLARVARGKGTFHRETGRNVSARHAYTLCTTHNINRKQQLHPALKLPKIKCWKTNNK